MVNSTGFWKPEACGIVLPCRLILRGQKLVENAKNSNETIWLFSSTVYWNFYSYHFPQLSNEQATVFRYILVLFPLWLKKFRRFLELGWFYVIHLGFETPRVSASHWLKSFKSWQVILSLAHFVKSRIPLQSPPKEVPKSPHRTHLQNAEVLQHQFVHLKKCCSSCHNCFSRSRYVTMLVFKDLNNSWQLLSRWSRDNLLAHFKNSYRLARTRFKFF